MKLETMLTSKVIWTSNFRYLLQLFNLCLFNYILEPQIPFQM